MRALDVHGFGGGFTLGVVQAGFTLVGKKSLDVGFGVMNCLQNTDLLGTGWEVDAQSPSKWSVDSDIDLVFGNPPCSGFSTLSRKDFRGIDSKVNHYMWELIHHAAKVKPRAVVFESVQQTFTQGLKLLEMLHDCLNEESGCTYSLYHVLHNNASVGGCSTRRRYYWVAMRDKAPFGVEANATRMVDDKLERYQLTRIPLLKDTLGDLEHLGLAMERQAYRGVVCDCDHRIGPYFECHCGKSFVPEGSWWTREQAHDGTGSVDGHDVAHSKTLARVMELLYMNDVRWVEGESMSSVLRRYYQAHKELPTSWHYGSKKKDIDGNVIPIRKDKRLIETDFAMGYNQPTRWHWDRMARVVTGGGVHLVVHPTQNRTMTHREVARIQGFPDAWKIWPNRHTPDLGPGWGKGVPVHTGRWIADWIKESLEGRPGSIADQVIDITGRYRPLARALGDFG